MTDLRHFYHSHSGLAKDGKAGVLQMKNWTVGILMFESVNELDFLGPFEVFANSDYIMRVPMFPNVQLESVSIDVRLIGRRRGVVTCEKGLRVEVPYSLEDGEELDVLVIP